MYLFIILFIIINNNNNKEADSVPLQLQTITDALDKLSLSGPVKSKYPLTFLDLNQVLFYVFLTIIFLTS